MQSLLVVEVLIWYAVYYLSEMDHFIKEKLGVKYYGRYMDDFYLIHKNKEFLKVCLAEIERIVGDLRLELNRKTDIYPIKNGITFLEFTHISKTRSRTYLVKFAIQNISQEREERRQSYPVRHIFEMKMGLLYWNRSRMNREWAPKWVPIFYSNDSVTSTDFLTNNFSCVPYSLNA